MGPDNHDRQDGESSSPFPPRRPTAARRASMSGDPGASQRAEKPAQRSPTARRSRKRPRAHLHRSSRSKSGQTSEAPSSRHASGDSPDEPKTEPRVNPQRQRKPRPPPTQATPALRPRPGGGRRGWACSTSRAARATAPGRRLQAGRAPHDSACRPRGKPTISPMKAAGVASPSPIPPRVTTATEKEDEGTDAHSPGPDGNSLQPWGDRGRQGRKRNDRQHHRVVDAAALQIGDGHEGQDPEIQGTEDPQGERTKGPRASSRARGRRPKRIHAAQADRSRWGRTRRAGTSASPLASIPRSHARERSAGASTKPSA